MSQKKVIGIVGPTGSGKTTLATGLSRKYHLQVHLEKPTDNPYLEQFYRELQIGGSSATALKSQLHFLLAAHQQAMEIDQSSDSVVWDVPLYGHRMYADLLHEAGTMSAADYQIYYQVYQQCLKTMLQPTVLLIVTTDVETLVARIKDRGRDMELATPQDYWQRQIQYWERQSSHLDTVPTLKLNSQRINWTSERGLSQVWKLAQPLIA